MNHSAVLIRLTLSLFIFTGLGGLITSCQTKQTQWTDEQAQELIDACLMVAEQTDDNYYTEYCPCIVDRERKRGAGYEQTRALFATPASYQDAGGECRVSSFEMPASWEEPQRRSLELSCRALARSGRLVDSSACPCLAERVVRRYRSIQQIDRLNERALVRITNECLNDARR